MIQSIIENIGQNLFKPLLLFFYAGFLIPLLKVEFEYPKALYQALTIVLLLGIGWHGGEELSHLHGGSELAYALGFMVVGFITNTAIGVLSYKMLRTFTRLRKVDAATVSGYYGSDSAGTFVTCVGFLTTVQVVYAPYMPVMLALMEIPGCLVALVLIARLREAGMDAQGNMPGEQSYISIENVEPHEIPAMDTSLVVERSRANGKRKVIDAHLLHEVLLNPGTFLLFAGVAIGLLSGLQGEKATEPVDHLFNFEFQGMLCLFLLEMGITACRRIKDLKTAGVGFIAFGLIAPNIFAMLGLGVAYGYSSAVGYEMQLGTYVLFMVLCGSASYIAVPAVQRMAIPEASPTLPLAASLGLTFTYNVTIGIPVYLEIAKQLTGLR
ncbi:MAG: sodium-dependent bicarbonate transport family permease [Planctomycetota bacterium]